MPATAALRSPAQHTNVVANVDVVRGKTFRHVPEPLKKREFANKIVWNHGLTALLRTALLRMAWLRTAPVVRPADKSLAAAATVVAVWKRLRQVVALHVLHVVQEMHVPCNDCQAALREVAAVAAPVAAKDAHNSSDAKQSAHPHPRCTSLLRTAGRNNSAKMAAASYELASTPPPQAVDLAEANADQSCRRPTKSDGIVVRHRFHCRLQTSHVQ